MDIKELMLVRFTKNHSIIVNPEIITVTAIKKKYLEQIPTHVWDEDPLSKKIRILGIMSYKVIMINERGKLEWTHRNDYIMYLTEIGQINTGTGKRSRTYKEAAEWAHSKILELPEIFED